mmetsp:Transcript_4640/g.9959  ORF Transcript_4640/g.9959 Transcript_4640/m.9959 type:complete len:91 (-) Transcript_4640:342-614(-)
MEYGRTKGEHHEEVFKSTHMPRKERFFFLRTKMVSPNEYQIRRGMIFSCDGALVANQKKNKQGSLNWGVFLGAHPNVGLSHISSFSDPTS